MFNDEFESVETQEVAEPEVDETQDLSEEVQEVAEPDSNEVEPNGKTERDSAFAEMRRNMQEAERRMREAESKVASMEASQRARADAISKLTGGKPDADLQALADSFGINVEDVNAVIGEAQEKESLKLENDQLKQQLANAENERALDNALVELKGIDDTLTKEEISEVLKFADKGLTVEDAYYVVKAKEINTRKTPPKDIGGIKETAPQGRDWFTEKEVDAMTPEQQEANYKKIIRSMAFWK